MGNPMGDSAASHEGIEVPRTITITEDQLSAMTASVAHLVLYKLRQEMHREIDKEVARLRIDHEKRWEQTLAQLRDWVRVEKVL